MHTPAGHAGAGFLPDSTAAMDTCGSASHERGSSLSGGEDGSEQSLRIFISYRRGDAPGHAGRLYDGLVSRFGGESVFMDVDGRTMRWTPGQDPQAPNTAATVRSLCLSSRTTVHPRTGTLM